MHSHMYVPSSLLPHFIHLSDVTTFLFTTKTRRMIYEKTFETFKCINTQLSFKCLFYHLEKRNLLKCNVLCFICMPAWYRCECTIHNLIFQCFANVFYLLYFSLEIFTTLYFQDEIHANHCFCYTILMLIIDAYSRQRVFIGPQSKMQNDCNKMLILLTK